MGDEFFVDNIVIYIAKEIVENCSSDSIINELKNMKEQMTIIYICMISFIVRVILNYVLSVFTWVTIIKYIIF